MANNLAIAVAGGFAAGFVIGVLVAPEKGTELRKKISDAAGTWADKLIDLFGRSAENLLPSGTRSTAVNPDEILG
jgi:gas vesicle protein